MLYIVAKEIILLKSVMAYTICRCYGSVEVNLPSSFDSKGSRGYDMSRVYIFRLGFTYIFLIIYWHKALRVS